MSWGFMVFLFCYIGYIVSLYRFSERYLKHVKIDKKAFIILLLVLETGIGILNESIGISYILLIMISHILYLGLFYLIFLDNPAKKIFTAMLLIAVRTLILNFGCSFFSCIVLVYTNWTTGGQVTYIEPGLENIIGAAAYCMVILVLNILRKRIGSVFQHKINNWYFLMSVFIAGIVAVVDLVNWGASNGIMVVSNVNGAEYWDVYYNQIFSHISICLLTALSVCIAGGFVFFMNKIYMEQRKKEQYDSQIEFYKMLNEQYLQMEGLRHDMKNHVLALYGLWEKKEFEKAEKYLKKMMENGNIGGSDEVTGNRAVDALLFSKKKKAEELSIRWVADMQIPKNCTVDEFDLCVLLGNLLDNAIKACTEITDVEYRFVDMQFQQIKKCLLLVIRNGTVLKDVKEIKQGMGIFNINETVRKYDGTVSMKVVNHVFEVSVLIPMIMTDIS